MDQHWQKSPGMLRVAAQGLDALCHHISSGWHQLWEAQGKRCAAWLLGKLRLNSHFSPVCLLGNASFPLLLWGENVSPKTYPKKQKDLLCPPPIWESWTQCMPLSVLTPDIIDSGMCWELTGEYKDNLGRTQLDEWLLFAFCVCMYILSDSFFYPLLLE